MVIAEAEVSSRDRDHHHHHTVNETTENDNEDSTNHHHHHHHTNGNSNGNGSNYVFPNLGLGRQSSIYSLTLDEFQHALSESGKNFGSMNMDEFLNSIWTAEENQAQAHAHAHHTSQYSHDPINSGSGQGRGMVLEKQPSLSLARQGSLSIPAPLCRKTVDQVWSEIQKTQEHQQQHQHDPHHRHSSSSNNNNNNNNNNNHVHPPVQSESPSLSQNPIMGNSGTTQRQPTFGEMTLEDFLVKAGVVREQCASIVPNPHQVAPTQPPQQQHPQFGYANPHQIGPGSYVGRPMMAGYQGEVSSGYGPGPKRSSNGYPAVAPTVTCYGGGRVSNGLSPISPGSSDGLGGQGENGGGGGQFGIGMEITGMRTGRKRIIDGPVEKVVERRQRRMIKNRESAARSRARKQAYTVELEAELNQLREENSQLKQALADMERRRKQQYVEEQKLGTLSKAQRAQERLKSMRRSRTCSL